MRQIKNRGAILGLFREMKSSVQKAISEGYFVEDNDGKLNLLKKAEESRVPELLRRYWKLEHGCELPLDEDLLETREIKELFSAPAETTRRQRPYQQQRQ